MKFSLVLFTAWAELYSKSKEDKFSAPKSWSDQLTEESLVLLKGQWSK